MALLLVETETPFLSGAGRSQKPLLDGGRISLAGLVLAALPPIEAAKPMDEKTAAD
jgi:hypothetical protein